MIGRRTDDERPGGRSRLLAAALLLLGCQLRPEPASTLRVWFLGHEGEFSEQALRGFREHHPQLRLEVQRMSWSVAHDRLLLAHRSGATPDAAQIGNSWIPELVALQALENLDSRIARSGVIAPRHYFTGIWHTNVVDGAVWGVPWYVDTRLVFYRKDILEQVGYSTFPRTWSAWREAMERVRARAQPGQHAILLPLAEWEQPVILALQNGWRLSRERGPHAFRDATFREAFEFYVGLHHDGLATGNTSGDLCEGFARGDFAMCVTGPWNLGEFRRRLPAEMQELWATAPMPAPDSELGGPGASLAGGASLVMFRASRAKDDVWRLITYLSEPQQQVSFYALTGDLPAQVAAWEDRLLARDPRAIAFWEQLHHLAPMPRLPEWHRIAERIHEHAERVVRGDSTIDESLAALDAEVDKMLERRGAPNRPGD